MRVIVADDMLQAVNRRYWAITDAKAVERQSPWHRECYFLTSGT
ncbi:hypothetical protein SAMN05192563_1007183 [Paraburkholderia aspalathi]|uniref:Uncharacterized protein n=1 Tax=Paraburkholderia aspalathi TaxID=1324617 RepID=A0A1I7CRF2_9BURK|nr:hypothetical protein SAMN05192563_1007183 [Paraburkholderia aspalathi]